MVLSKSGISWLPQRSCLFQSIKSLSWKLAILLACVNTLPKSNSSHLAGGLLPKKITTVRTWHNTFPKKETYFPTNPSVSGAKMLVSGSVIGKKKQRNNKLGEKRAAETVHHTLDLNPWEPGKSGRCKVWWLLQGYLIDPNHTTLLFGIGKLIYFWQASNHDLWKRKIIFKSDLGRDMLVSRRVYLWQVSNYDCKFPGC